MNTEDLLEQYSCGPVKFSGRDDALYERHLMFDQVAPTAKATAREQFEAAARSARDVLSQRWIKTEQTYQQRNAKRVYYLSMEYLIGRALANNITNLRLEPVLEHFVEPHKLDPLEVIEQEPDAGLGNGGLGRLAACFSIPWRRTPCPAWVTDCAMSTASSARPFATARNTSKPDHWLARPDPWEVVRFNEAVEVKLNCSFEIREGALRVRRGASVDSHWHPLRSAGDRLWREDHQHPSALGG